MLSSQAGQTTNKITKQNIGNFQSDSCRLRLWLLSIRTNHHASCTAPEEVRFQKCTVFFEIMRSGLHVWVLIDSSLHQTWDVNASVESQYGWWGWGDPRNVVGGQKSPDCFQSWSVCSTHSFIQLHSITPWSTSMQWSHQQWLKSHLGKVLFPAFIWCKNINMSRSDETLWGR